MSMTISSDYDFKSVAVNNERAICTLWIISKT
jgi:hypothetical protein